VTTDPRPGLPRGGVTLLVGTVSGLSVAVLDFPATAVSGAVGATVGAAVADPTLAALQRRRPDLPSLAPALAAGVAVLVWSGQLVGLAVADGVRWPVSLWLGVVILAGFVAAALGMLSTPSRV
jgi:hypothetical protein